MPQNQRTKYDVFLSHNRKDKPAVKDLKRRLAARGLRVWYDEDELRPGTPWLQLLESGVESSGSVAVLVGSDGLGPWEDEEMQAALVLAVKSKRPVIPILLPGAPKAPKLPIFLRTRTWVKMKSGFKGDGMGNLIWGITGLKPRRKTADAPPIIRIFDEDDSALTFLANRISQQKPAKARLLQYSCAQYGHIVRLLLKQGAHVELLLRSREAPFDENQKLRMKVFDNLLEHNRPAAGKLTVHPYTRQAAMRGIHLGNAIAVGWYTYETKTQRDKTTWLYGHNNPTVYAEAPSAEFDALTAAFNRVWRRIR